MQAGRRSGPFPIHHKIGLQPTLYCHKHLRPIVLFEPAETRLYPELRMHDLDFVDDIALSTTSSDSAEKLLQIVEDTDYVRLHLNADKTKYISLEERVDSHPEEEEKKKKGNP